MRATREPASLLGLVLALVAATLFLGGGSGDGAVPWLGAAAGILALSLAAARGVPRGWTALAPAAALAGWCFLSIWWSALPDRTWDYANRTLVYVAFAAVGLYLAPRTRELALGLAALLGAVAVWALAGKAFPWLGADYGRVARLRDPVGIWNQLALLGDYALPLALWLAWRRRVLGALLAYAWLVAIVLTYSRGGVLVAVVVVVAWILLSRRWLEAGATLVAAGVPAAAVVAVALALPGVTSDGESHATRTRDGLLFALALVAGAAACAALAHVPLPAKTTQLRRAALALAGAVAVAVLAAAIVSAPTVWRQFTSTSATQLSNESNRFGTAGSNHRWVWWQQAWHGFRDRPLEGSGAGTFQATNLRYRTTYLDQTTEPHDVPLQFLSETGIVGLALLAAAFAFLLRAARRGDGAELALWLILPAWLLHALLDIDWDFAAVTAPMFLVAGVLSVRATAPARRPSPFAALAAAGVALALLSSLLLPWLGDRWAGEAERAIDRPARAVTLAKRARAVNPLAADPLFTQALAEQLRRRDDRAAALLKQATRVQPDNAETWFRLGEFLLDGGCPRAALPALERFTELNPQDRDGAEYGRALKLVDSGTPRC